MREEVEYKKEDIKLQELDKIEEDLNDNKSEDHKKLEVNDKILQENTGIKEKEIFIDENKNDIFNEEKEIKNKLSDDLIININSPQLKSCTEKVEFQEVKLDEDYSQEHILPLDIKQCPDVSIPDKNFGASERTHQDQNKSNEKENNVINPNIFEVKENLSSPIEKDLNINENI